MNLYKGFPNKKINANTFHMNIQEAEIKITSKVIAIKCTCNLWTKTAQTFYTDKISDKLLISYNTIKVNTDSLNSSLLQSSPVPLL